MGWTYAFLVASAPGLFWLWVFYRRDRWEPEPKLKVLQLFLLGATTAVPVWFIERSLPGPLSPLYDNLVRVALTEEFFKLLPVLLFAYWHREFDEPMDGIVYAVAAALGFATVENALYAHYLGPQLILQRAFTATLAHVAFSGFVGYALGRAKFRRGTRPRFVLRAFVVVVLLHGAYDFTLSAGSRWAILVLLPAALVMLFWATQRACRHSPFRLAADAHALGPREQPHGGQHHERGDEHREGDDADVRHVAGNP